MDTVKILWNKDPVLHDYLIDVKKSRFYKRYSIDGRGTELFQSEVDNYKRLEKSRYIPKLYNVYREGDRNILELEYIPFLPLIGHAGEIYNEEKGSITEEQYVSIKKQLIEFHNELQKFVIEGRLYIELSLHHLIYDYINDRIVFVDLSNAVNCDKDVCKVISNQLQNFVGEHTKSCIDICKDLLLVKGKDKVLLEESNSIYKEGENLLREIKSQPWGFVQHSIFINDKFFIGHRDTFHNRNKVMQIGENELVGKTVLDIGCNIGGGLQYFAERGASKIIGVDTTCASLLCKFVHYLKRIHPIYNNIRVIPGDIRTIIYSEVIPDIDVCFYLSCLAYCGCEHLHKKLSEKCKVVYLEGHSDDATSHKTTQVIKEFGNSWEWKLLGHTDNMWEDKETYKPRPVYKGVKK